MPALHVIDAARIVHETCRRYWPESTHPMATATWGDLPEDARGLIINEVQAVLDKEKRPNDAASRLISAITESLRPFLEE